MAGINSSCIASAVATCTRPKHCFRLGMPVSSQFLQKLKPSQIQQMKVWRPVPVGYRCLHSPQSDAYFKLGAAINPPGPGGQLAVEAGARHHQRVREGQKLVQLDWYYLYLLSNLKVPLWGVGIENYLQVYIFVIHIYNQQVLADIFYFVRSNWSVILFQKNLTLIVGILLSVCAVLLYIWTMVQSRVM